MQTLRDSLETINHTAAELIDDIDEHFAEIVKEAEKNMPDPTVRMEQMHEYGYHFDGMLPLSLERAKELFDQDVEIYRLYEDDTEGCVLDNKEFDTHNGLFGVEKEVWEHHQRSTVEQEARETKHKCAERER